MWQNVSRPVRQELPVALTPSLDLVSSDVARTSLLSLNRRKFPHQSPVIDFDSYRIECIGCHFYYCTTVVGHALLFN